MRRNRQEWDWPPRRRPSHYGVLDASPVDGSGWNSPAATRIASIYWRGVMLGMKVVVGGILGAVLVGCAYLFATILNS